MYNLYIEEFVEGMRSKMAEEPMGSMFDLGGSAIFPRLENQAKWQFARKDKHLRLNDGTHVYAFHLPHGEKEEEDFQIERQEDIPVVNFDKDVDASGTAQIHRADPGSIYFTLHDGHTNPTYTFKHTGGKTWKGIPKLRKKTPIIGDEFIKGAEEYIKSAASTDFFNNIIGGGLNMAARGATGLKNLVLAPGWNPGKAALIGAGIGGAYDLGKRTFYNTEEENAQETGLQRASRYVLPAAGLGLLGAAEGGWRGGGLGEKEPLNANDNNAIAHIKQIGGDGDALKANILNNKPTVPSGLFSNYYKYHPTYAH